MAVLLNRCFNTSAELRTVLAPHLARLSEQLQRIRSPTFFHWWPVTGPLRFNRVS